MKSRYSKFSGLALGLVLATSTSVTTAADAPSSGFLPKAVESNMNKGKLDDGDTVMRWMSPDLAKGKYSAIMIDRVVYYPAPNPGPQVSSSTLEAITDNLTATLRVKVNNKVPVVDKAGPGVLRLQAAISSISIAKEGLSKKDILPVHLLFSAAKSASGNMNENVTVNLEVRVTDSMSGDYMIAVKRGIEGKQLESNKDMLGPDDMRKALDEAATDAAEALHHAMTQ